MADLMSDTRSAVADTGGTQGDRNRLRPEDRPGHQWYRFVLSFPQTPTLVIPAKAGIHPFL